MEDFNNLTEKEKIWYKKYIKYKTKYEELKQIGSGLITISDEDYKKILGIEYIYFPIKYNYFTYDYAVAYFFIKTFNDGIPTLTSTPTRAATPKEIDMLGGADDDNLGGGRCIDSIRYFIKTIEKAKLVRKQLGNDQAIEKKYKKVILNYLLQILNLKNILGDNLKNKKSKKDITDDNITDSCNLMRIRLIEHHAKVSHTKITDNDKYSLNNIYGQNPDQSRDKVELYYGFYVGLIICILHSLDSGRMVTLTEKINHSLNHFFEKVREKEKENFINNFLKKNTHLVQNKESVINRELQEKYHLTGIISDDMNKNINQNFNKFNIPENYPEELLDIPEQNLLSGIPEQNLKEYKDYQFLKVVYDQITA